MNDKLRDMIASRAPMSEIKRAARDSDMRTLRHVVLQAVRRGETTFEELERVTLDD